MPVAGHVNSVVRRVEETVVVTDALHSAHRPPTFGQ